MLDKFLVVVSGYINKKEITSFELEAFGPHAAWELARARYKQQVQFGSLKQMRDVPVSIEVVELS